MNVLIRGKDFPASEDEALAFFGFEELDAEITLHNNFLMLSKEELSKYDVCVSCVNDIQHILFKFGVKNYDIPCYPKKLKKFLKREVVISKLKVILPRMPKDRFIKPVRPKRFQAFITDSTYNPETPTLLMNLSDDELVYVSHIVKFESEWRVYVRENRIQNVCYYKGDPTIFPDPITIRRMISSWEGPCCYGLDVGVSLSTGYQSTLLVEVNDFYSLGNYGLFPRDYAEMLYLRWRELLDGKEKS